MHQIEGSWSVGTLLFDKIKELQQPIVGYQQVVTSYNNEKVVPSVFESAETIAFEARIEENLRRSIRQRGLLARIQDCDLFYDNKVYGDGDFVYFALMVYSESVKMKEVVSDPKLFVLWRRSLSLLRRIILES